MFQSFSTCITGDKMEYTIDVYADLWKFEDGLLSRSKNNWKLHSWNRDRDHTIAVFYRDRTVKTPAVIQKVIPFINSDEQKNIMEQNAISWDDRPIQIFNHGRD
jgi:hypothetical protein